MVTVCKICHKEFKHKPSKKRKYCSMSCYRISRKDKLLKKPTIIACMVCGKKFIAKKWSVKNRGKKYCSLKCRVKSQMGKSPMQGKKHSTDSKKKMSVAKIGKYSGDKASNWKGGITPLDKVQRIKFRNYFQKNIFERDNYTCQICGKTNCHLQVDHIQPWAEYVEQRFNIDNCRTLCQKCHYKITFGKEMPKNVKTWGQNLSKLERVRILS